jgi:hypothetical protein
VEIRRLWDTACSAAVVKIFVYMRRSESTSSTNAVTLAISVWYVWCARARLVCCESEAWQWLGESPHLLASAQGRTMKPVCVNRALSIDNELTCVEGARLTNETTTSIYRAQRLKKPALERPTRCSDWRASHSAATILPISGPAIHPLHSRMTSRTTPHTSSKRQYHDSISSPKRIPYPTNQHECAQYPIRLRHHQQAIKTKQKGDPTQLLGRFELPILQA